MGSQVLARKWRPKNFHQLVGQEQTSRALINALDTNRLHHAYLFTGTRGVGKTTIARILAKCLNCETGVTSQPCSQCSTCQAIDAGRFVDLIEVDAASRTKVEDTRELLDNVQYAPTQGRYKVYLIDEVHMLSSHSFNALLKTLEEPPEHVKFLLATTDPQKLPITVLSRCLQFQLKNMPAERVVEHLQDILTKEGAEFEIGALNLLGKAADGSMRDGLSLTEQALAYGQGKLKTDEVAALLGVLDQEHLLSLLKALVAQDARQLLAEVNRLAELAPDFSVILQDFASLLHQLTLAQFVPEALAEQAGREELLNLAKSLSAEEVQLYYQLAIESKRDLPLAPEPKTGLEMALLRMLAFRPQGIPQPPSTPLAPTGTSGTNHQPTGNINSAPAAYNASPVRETIAPEANLVAAEPTPAIEQPVAIEIQVSRALQNTESAIAEAGADIEQVEQATAPIPEIKPSVVITKAVELPAIEQPILATASVPNADSFLPLANNEDWLNLAPKLEISGRLASQVRQLSLVSSDTNQLTFALPARVLSFLDANFQQVLSAEITRLTGLTLELVFSSENPQQLDNLMQRKEKNQQAELAACTQAFEATSEIQLLKQTFDATLTQILPAGWNETNSSLH